ncbi:pyrophosphate--fructose 6-phosphate 1-phosphotransferase subunit beta [Artemisia annua]|uniref:Pyrophosphate--fructose 6-phosphate 1-phosphotransferase subunit beta n=1 Tax=Artemisia annua TaxID=35608 RepID=A0A2U1PBP8_ARTAN|nr:pyrophosphate--fructose 6-phosphate 1-phosphotransferase subunit beta [Artemisia annua]
MEARFNETKEFLMKCSIYNTLYLHDRCKGSTMYGFRGAPVQIMKGKYVMLTPKSIYPYINQVSYHLARCEKQDLLKYGTSSGSGLPGTVRTEPLILSKSQVPLVLCILETCHNGFNFCCVDILSGFSFVEVFDKDDIINIEMTPVD